MEKSRHPTDPRSNVSKYSGYEPDKYALTDVSLTVRTDESLTPGRPPVLTQNTIGKHLLATTNELSEYGPKPTIDELPDAVLDQMVQRDKAFWVDKPGANAYTLHDAYYDYGMTSEIVKPTIRKKRDVKETSNKDISKNEPQTKSESLLNALLHRDVSISAKQDVFPRSYQYDLDCVRYRREHACDGLKDPEKKAIRAQCRDCTKMHIPGLTPFQLAWAKDPGQKRWRYYPDFTSSLTAEEIRDSMGSVGRPFQNEACNWYYENYPPVKYNYIVRKFSK